MRAIEPDMVLGKQAIASGGERLGEIVDVGLYTHDRVKFLVVQRGGPGAVPIRRVEVGEITQVSADSVRLSVA
ncbi:MAG TPA: hypothetical protein VM370_10575 [Candidatus Thermoplasmatota archaeon]|nr:hypothetical protein [Candidatus Thermoplasmatota archaeon]